MKLSYFKIFVLAVVWLSGCLFAQTNLEESDTSTKDTSDVSAADLGTATDVERPKDVSTDLVEDLTSDACGNGTLDNGEECESDLMIPSKFSCESLVGKGSTGALSKAHAKSTFRDVRKFTNKS